MNRRVPIILAVASLVGSNAAFALGPAPMCALPPAPETSVFHGAADMVCLWQPPLRALRASWPDLCPQPGSDGSFPVRLSAAQHSMAEARALTEEGQHAEALLHLRVVAAAMPEIDDYIAFMEGELYEALDDPDQAAAQYKYATLQTPNADLRALARVGRARAMLAANDLSAPTIVLDLLRRYPEVPEVAQLKLGLGQMRERQKRLSAAVSLYHSLDLNYPGYPAAEEARARLDALRARKVWVPHYTPQQAVERAERLVRSGPVELSRSTVAELQKQTLPPPLKLTVDALAARLALVKGDFDGARQLARKSAEAEAEPAPLEEERLARTRVRNLLRGRKPTVVIPIQVVKALEIAARANVTDLTDELVASLTVRGNRVPPRLRFDALVVATGVATEAQLIALADTLLTNRAYGTAALYHRGRALERAGQLELAKEDFERVMELDNRTERFYAQWAEQRLRALAHEKAADPCYAIDAPLKRCLEDRPAAGDGAGSLGPDISTALTRLPTLVAKHGEAYPWLGRAMALLQLGEAQLAADEIHESYLAWRSAAGKPPLRAGTDAVFRGEATGRVPPNFATRRDRRLLSFRDRLELAAVASALGDYGTAVLYGGVRWAEPLPRPFFDIVEAAAARHGIDPDLLYAVMRVESVYNNRIISYAGAVGLMQIMPRTGRLIADALEHGHLTTTDLLRPEVNIDFAAWYLRSLLDRMDGRLPLAIASYNGGPHNVRKWMHRYGDHVPLDAFLERIPFSQTHRYVRRVLGYYAQYRAQRGEKLSLMSIELPEPQVDAVGF